jgi:hypothetical protein
MATGIAFPGKRVSDTEQPKEVAYFQVYFVPLMVIFSELLKKPGPVLMGVTARLGSM